MSKTIFSIMVAGAAFAGFVGTQITQTSAASPNSVPQSVATLANTLDDNSSSLNPVVIELFTSQGCSSCPPADMLASRLAKDDSLLVISRPVTYWDRLGWKDTLARPQNTALQRAYASKGNEGSGVYTPQIVVNGGDGAVGSREGDIRSIVRRARVGGPEITVDKDDRGQFIVTISGKSAHMASVSLLALSSSETVSVGRGENGGRKSHYVNVVKSETNLGSWRGDDVSFPITNDNFQVFGADKYAVILQRPGAGPIIGAKLLGI